MRTVIGVMGGAVSNETVARHAREIGRAIAEQGFVLLNGGRDAGAMAESAKGAADAGGLVIGILPGDDCSGVAPSVDVAIPTGMGDARNAINVLASHVVVALPGGAGTISEVALALKSQRPVVTVGFPLAATFPTYLASGLLVDASTPTEAISHVMRLLGKAVT